MKTLEELQELNKAELKKYAFEDLALDLKGNLSEETLISKIMDAQDDVKNASKQEEAPKEVKAKPTKEYTELAKDLEKHLESHIGRGLGFDADEVSYTISYRNQVISGNLTVPPVLVARQADTILNRK